MNMSATNTAAKPGEDNDLYMDPVNLPMPPDQLVKSGIKSMTLHVMDMKDSAGTAVKNILIRYDKNGKIIYRGTAIYELKIKNKKFDTLSSERFKIINDTLSIKEEWWPNDKGVLEKTRSFYLFYNKDQQLLKDSSITFSAKDTVVEKYSIPYRSPTAHCSCVGGI